MRQKVRLIIALTIITIMLSGSVFAAKLGTLKEVLKPQMIKVQGDELFVVEGHKVFIYNLKNFSLKKTIGKAGEGPGEFMPEQSRTIVISVLPDLIVGESRHKVLFFNRDGKFIKELRKPPTVIQTVPIGENFVTLKILYGKEGKNFFTVGIHDSNFKEIKELYRQKFFTFQKTS